jgi:bifunctional non-homologous end joining protein LigD
VYLANQACIAFHGWLSRKDALRRPDQLVFDLDPAGGGFESVRFAAHVVRQLLDELECRSFCKTTGSRGLHVVVPLRRDSDFDEVRELAHDIAEVAADREPRRLTTKTRKDARRGRLFLDYLRNSYAQHAVVPYSLRALPGAPVATPLDWSELEDAHMDARRFRLDNVFRRLGQKDDPWQGWRRHAVSSVALRRRLQALTGEQTD